MTLYFGKHVASLFLLFLCYHHTVMTVAMEATLQTRPIGIRSQLVSSALDQTSDFATTTTTTQSRSISPDQVDKEERDLIVGGTLAEPGDFPWFVTATSGGYCGASLIAESVILTAAHCDKLFEVGSTVVVGALRRSDRDNGTAQSRRVTQRIAHPSYQGDVDSNNYDLMLVQLEAPVTNVPLLAWNTNGNLPAVGTTVTAMGFGKTSFNGEPSQELRKVDLVVAADNLCSWVYGPNYDSRTMVCATHSAGAQALKGTCQGDSGGPLVMTTTTTTTTTTSQTGQPSHLQVGVVSWGFECGDSDYPGVYARPDAVQPWMESTICRLSPECSGIPVPYVPPPTIITINFRYDDFPNETTWKLVRVDDDNGQEQDIAIGPTNSPEPGDEFAYTLFHPSGIPAGIFRFVVQDSGHNGLQDSAFWRITAVTVATPTIPASTDPVLVNEGPQTTFTSTIKSDPFALPPLSSSTSPGGGPVPPTSGSELNGSTPMPTPAPATFPSTTSTPAPTLKEPCVCEGVSSGCIPLACSAVKSETTCKNLGCKWLGITGDGAATSNGVRLELLSSCHHSCWWLLAPLIITIMQCFFL